MNGWKIAAIVIYLIGGWQTALLTKFSNERACREMTPAGYILVGVGWVPVSAVITGMMLVGKQTRYQDTFCGLGLEK